MKGSTLMFKYPALIDIGKHGVQKVKIIDVVFLFCPSLVCIIFLAAETFMPFSCKSATRSSGFICDSSKLRITPFDVFILLCGDTLTGTEANRVCFSRLLACPALVTSTRSTPERNFFTDFTSPAKPFIAFSMMKGDNDDSGLPTSVGSTTRNLGQFACFVS